MDRAIAISEKTLHMGMTLSEALTYSLVLSMSPEGSGTWCHASTSWMADFLGLSQRGVQVALQRLTKRGLLERMEISAAGGRRTLFRPLAKEDVALQQEKESENGEEAQDGNE